MAIVISILGTGMFFGTAILLALDKIRILLTAILQELRHGGSK